MKLATGWVTRTDLSAIDTGLAPEEALRRAPELLHALRDGKISPAETRLDDAAIDVLHAACSLIPELPVTESENPLKNARALYELIEKATWPEPDFEERVELLADCAFAAWRLARKTGTPAEIDKWQRRFLSIAGSVSSLRSRVEAILATPIPERIERADDLGLEDPELLLCLCQVLRSRGETSPTDTRRQAESLYGFLEEVQGKIGLSDERDYFLGEFALIAGTASRFLFRREEASLWFARAESRFWPNPNSEGQIARLAYQRLALGLEERQFEQVLELAPHWFEVLTKLELREDALKCRFLEGIALRETGKVRKAIQLFQDICRIAEALGSITLVAEATNNLAEYYRLLGDLKESYAHAERALLLLEQVDNRVGLAKLRWHIGDILREQGKLGEAFEAYRSALGESEKIGLRNDVAAIHLVLAEILLDSGFANQAEAEIRAALPIIEEEKMVPEGFAALALLQESLRRRQIDREALRNLHGYFHQSES